MTREEVEQKVVDYARSVLWDYDKVTSAVGGSPYTGGLLEHAEWELLRGYSNKDKVDYIFNKHKSKPVVTLAERVDTLENAVDAIAGRLVKLETERTEETDEPISINLKVGEWYFYGGYCTTQKPLMLITRIGDTTITFKGFNFLGDWIDSDWYPSNQLHNEGFREATPDEIRYALIEESEARGLTVENIARIECLRGNTSSAFDDPHYNPSLDELWSVPQGWGGKLLYARGEWATLLKEEPLKEGDLVKAWNADEEHCYVVGRYIQKTGVYHTVKSPNPSFPQQGFHFTNVKKITKDEAVKLLRLDGDN